MLRYEIDRTAMPLLCMRYNRMETSCGGEQDSNSRSEEDSRRSERVKELPKKSRRLDPGLVLLGGFHPARVQVRTLAPN